MNSQNEKTIRRRHQDNGVAWDETAAIYERDEARDIAHLRAGGHTLLGLELPFLSDLGGWCGRAVHLQCSGGSDALSLWNLGAREVVGVDISERMIGCARRKTAALGAPATWHCCDILDTPHTLDNTADLVYTGKGALPWMMDIGAWARVVARLLAPGTGRLYVFEGHPIDWVWDTDADTLRFDPHDGDYFSGGCLAGHRWPAPFLDDQERPSDADRPRLHERQWTLGAILNSLVDAGLYLERFEEYPDLYWNQFPNLPEHIAARLPHTFSLRMRKPGTRA